MSDFIFRQLTPNILIASRPFVVARILSWGGRSTFILLPSSELFIVVSTPLNELTRSALLEFAGRGWEERVGWLVAPDVEHHLFFKDWSSAFPSAKTIGPARLVEKVGGFDFAVDATPPALPESISPFIKIQPFPKHTNHELAIFHALSRTLIEADLIFNLPGTEQFSKTKPPFLGSLLTRTGHPGGWFHKVIINSTSGKGLDAIQTGKDASVVASWDFDRIIPCHGDVIEKEGKKVWNLAYGELQAAAAAAKGK